MKATYKSPTEEELEENNTESEDDEEEYEDEDDFFPFGYTDLGYIGSQEEEYGLMEMPESLKEIEITDTQGEKITLSVYQGLFKNFISYQVFGEEGFLSDDNGNLVDFEGNILVKKDDLISLMKKQKKGEKIDLPTAIKVADIY